MQARPLSATFLFPYNRYAEWTHPQWERELDAMWHVGIDTVVLGWTVRNQDMLAPAGSSAMLDALMEAAARRGMRVFLGLADDTVHWWWNPGRCYDTLRDRSLEVARRLLDRYGNRTELAGWYLPPELDDFRWAWGAARRRLVDHYLGPVTRWLHDQGGLPVMVSPFFYRRFGVGVFQRWWKSVLAECPVGIVALQDGVGCRRALPHHVPPYLDALHEAAQGTGTRIWANVELFRLRRQWPPWRFETVPATCDRIVQQVEAVEGHAERLICFEFSSHMGPARGAEQEHLYGEYVRRCCPGAGHPDPYLAEESHDEH